MPKYHYVITSRAGVKKESTLVASNVNAAREKIKNDDVIIISITEEKTFITRFWERPGLSFQEKMLFTKHMATMTKTGVTITEALEIIANQTKEKNNKKMFETILEMVRSGQSFSKSLQVYDYIFPEIFTNMIATGEESGNLEDVFERLSLQLEKEYEIRKKVVSAFIYPSILLGMTLLITLGIIIFIMPKITNIFKSFDVKLPLITRSLISFSDFLKNNPILSTFIAGGGILFFIVIFKLKQLKPFWDNLLLHIPFFGRIVIYANLARISRTLNSLLQSAVPVAKALGTTAHMIGNKNYKTQLNEAVAKVEQGAKLGESLSGNEKLFPEIITKMIAIGEKTGNLELTMKRLAELYESSLDSLTRNLSVILEPILLLFMAGLVGSIVLAIILPIYQLPSLLQR